ncbi:hypothetical protein FJM67_12000 [Maribrevibacterium harenarium]|uniref:Uncharacterized protein n=2 Tax=Maribrevibacterium harenarium TaxID=2589817 RepID=A0A501WU33_9GAMM|nr:hypothetical protein FJM67_12000 [Maribrevibacterium harenarium]
MVFARFRAIYTNRFDSAYSTSDDLKLAKREWALALKGFQEPLLAYAVERVKERFAWPPTISEFLSEIHTAYQSYGLKEPRQAYLEACSSSGDPRLVKWSHPAVFHAGSDCGWSRLRSEEERISWPMFEQAYQKIIDRVMAGETLSIPVVTMIEHQQAPELETLMQKIRKQIDAPEQEWAHHLYYLYKTKGTGIRQQYRQRAQFTLAKLGYREELPE